MIELIVNDMMCDGCAGTISRAISRVDRVGRARIDLEGRWVSIESRKGAARFVSAIAAAGFTPLLWWDGSPAPLDLPTMGTYTLES